jgi:hypothetical protein
MRYNFFYYNMLPSEIFMKRQALCLLLPLFLAGIAAAEAFQFTENNDKKQLSLSEGTLPILTYQYDVIEHENVPPNNPRRFAGCYVHPLHGLHGEILTDNAPADHYHHHGVFWTWPHVGVREPDGKTTEYNLWESNTALKRYFVRWIDKTLTEQTAAFEVENGWFIGNPQEGKKIMTERVKVIVHRIQKGDVANRAVDFEFQWQPTGKPITLRGSEGKSYGGFTVRLKPFVQEGKREAERSEINRITVPTGIADKDLPETPLAWADYTSNFPRLVDAADVKVTLGGKPLADAVVLFTPEDQPSGAAIFIPKTHPDFPPTWLTRYYGPLCVGWPGVAGRNFQPGEEIKLRYRIWIHDGAVTVPQIEKAYEEYNR